MRDALRLYFHYIAISIRSQMQYRGSFVMMTLGYCLMALIEFAGIWVLFDRFKMVKGWTLPEVAIIYSIVYISFAISEAMTRGFDIFYLTVKSGDFDRVLLRPRSTVLQILGQELQLMRFGGAIQGLIILIWAAGQLDIAWTAARIGFTIAAITGAGCFFGGIYVLQATFCFWTIEGIELMNVLTYGGRETAQFPITMYRTWFRRFFTWVVPLAFVTYYPSLAIIGRSETTGLPAILFWLAPLAGVVFLVMCLQVWKFGVRRYCSTGS